MLSTISTIVVAVITAAGGFLVAKMPKAGTREIAFINELQEEMKDQKEEIKEMRKEINQIAFLSKEQSEYIFKLRLHILNELPPPPPEYPEALLSVYSRTPDPKSSK